MDQVSSTDYPRIIRGIVEHYAQFKPSAGEVEVEVVIDEVAGHYELLHTGWANGYRIHGAVIHIDVRGDKIWVQHDGTEDGITQQLLNAGIRRAAPNSITPELSVDQFCSRGLAKASHCGIMTAGNGLSSLPRGRSSFAVLQLMRPGRF